MELVKIGGLDVTEWIKEEGLHISPKVMVSEKSQRNARGTMTIDIIARKTQITCDFMPLDDAQMRALLNVLYPYSNIPVTYRDVRTGQNRTIVTYSGDYDVVYCMARKKILYNEISVTLTEM